MTLPPYTVLMTMVACLIIAAFGLKKNNVYLIYIPLGLVLLLLSVKLFSLFQVDSIRAEFQQGSVEFLNHAIQIIAFMCAGLYFLYQLVGNLDITDLSLSVTTQRVHIDALHDRLAIKLELKKGPIASVHVHDIRAFVYAEQQDTPLIVQRFRGIERTAINYLPGDQSQFFATAETDDSEKYRMAASESTEFADYVSIHPDQDYRVVVVVITRRRKLMHMVVSQFKASAVSIHNTADHTERHNDMADHR